jgi:hypothetical protein
MFVKFHAEQNEDKCLDIEVKIRLADCYCSIMETDINRKNRPLGLLFFVNKGGCPLIKLLILRQPHIIGLNLINPEC